MQAVSMLVCVWGGELQRLTASLVVFSGLVLTWSVSRCILGVGVLAVGEQPRCIAQVALWSFGTDALQLRKLGDRWEPRLVAQLPS